MRIQQGEVKVGKRKMIVEKSFRLIHISDKVFHQNMKTYKGSRTDTNLLNINFKTIITRILDQLCQTKQVNSDQIHAIQVYKSSSPSFQNLVSLIYEIGNREKDVTEMSVRQSKNRQSAKIEKREGQTFGCRIRSPNILKRLRKLFESSEITRKVYQTEGTLTNKLLMLKYIEAIRYTIVGKGKIVKWKQLKSVTVLK